MTTPADLMEVEIAFKQRDEMRKMLVPLLRVQGETLDSAIHRIERASATALEMICDEARLDANAA
jgi:hypothetical protein